MEKVEDLKKDDMKKTLGQRKKTVVLKRFDFETTVDLYETSLLRYVGHLIGTQGHEVEDVVQETFLCLHKKVESDGIGSISNIQVWLYRVAHNRAMDAGRKRLRDKKVADRLSQEVLEERNAVDEVEILGEIIRREVCEKAMEELQCLPGELRHVVLLKVIQGMTMSQISEVLDISASNVCYRLSKALRLISVRLKEAGLI